MAGLSYAFGVLLVLLILSTAFLNANPARIASGLRLVAPMVLGVAGAGLLLLGRAALGGMLLSGALAWYTSGRVRRGGRRKAQGQRSTVRTAALEMTLDHDTGGLEGFVLAGRFEGSQLGAMTEDDLLVLRTELAGDGESLQLLETYLDGRSAGWRERVDADIGAGQAGAQSSGPMTKQEAYKVLGLEPGAGAAEIRKAHRRLMQRLHPDLGGSSFLASRINEAKDVLLSTHR